MSETWMLAVGDADALRDAVLARYAAGPFVESSVDHAWLRQIEIGDGFVREIGDDLDREYLARYLAEHTREPVVLQWPDSERGYEVAPGDDPVDQVREVDRREVPGRPVHHLVYAVDSQRQFAIERAFESELPTKLGALFPIQNRRKTARLDCKSVKTYGPTANFSGLYDRRIQVELQLALYEWSADGNERSMIELRTDTTTLGRYDLITPTGELIQQGRAIVKPYDEYAVGFETSMRRLVRRIRDAMDRTSWAGVTIEWLVDPDDATGPDRP